MSTRRFIFAGAILLFVGFSSGLVSSNNAFGVNGNIKVEGGMISGITADGVISFKGIPFAAPPVGDLRWRAPQSVIPWQGVRAADSFGAECPQTPYPVGSMYYSPPQKQSEDCLFLNVWTTAKQGDKRPVMVWIHGGALTRGSGSTQAYNGAAFARKDVVLVTINYRLGVLGYMAHPELTAESPNHSSGNYGVLDQIAALKWVQKNIAAFGGDPTKVTIFGESAGSWSVNVLIASPLAKGLFRGAIGESGGVFQPGAFLKDEGKGGPSAESIGLGFGKAVGAASIKDLRALPAEKIVDMFKLQTVIAVDGWVLPDEVRNICAKGKQNDVNVIVGSNANEMTSLFSDALIPKKMEDYRKRVESQYGERIKEYDAAYPVHNEEEIRDAYLASFRDSIFTWQMRTWARMTATGHSKAYLYFFSHVPPNKISKLLGAYHAGEITYVFNNLNRQNELLQDVDFKLADMMNSYWVNFATTGDPNGKGLPNWPAYDRENEPYMDFGDTVQSRNHLLKAQIDFQDLIQNHR
jgi:para-nitrobenzyl esterase